MEINRRVWWLVFSLVVLLSVSVVSVQLTGSTTELVASEGEIELISTDEIEKLSPGDQFTVSFHNIQSEQIAAPIDSQSSTQSSSQSNQVENVITSSDELVENSWVIELPTGIAFDEEGEKILLRKSGSETTLPVFQYNQENSQLRITADSTIDNIDVKLTAEKAGEYELFLANEQNPVNKSNPLRIVVADRAEASSVETPKADVPQATSTSNLVSKDVSSWDEFVFALGDKTISQIRLKSNIVASNKTTVTNVFSTTMAKKGTDNTTLLIDLKASDPSGYEYFFVNTAISRKLVIDGNGHNFNFGNIAIGFNDTSINSNNYWDITLQNIKVESSNPYAPFYYPKLRYAGEGGMSDFKARLSKITYGNYSSSSTSLYGSDYHHKKYVANMGEFFLAYANRSVTDIELTNNLVFPSGSQRVDYQLPNIDNASTNIFGLFDIYKTNASGTAVYLYTQITGSARALNVEGAGYIADFGALALCVDSGNQTLYDGSSYSLRWHQTFKNLNFFHGNYWGPIEIQDLQDAYEKECWQRFENITDKGSQFLQASSSVLYLAGNIRLEQQKTYRAYDSNGYPLRANEWSVFSHRQQTLGVWTAKIEDNANVYLSSLGGPCIDLYSGGQGLTIGKNVKLEAFRGGNDISEDGAGAVLAFRGGNLTVGENAKMKLTSSSTSDQSSIISMNNTSSIDIKAGATVDLYRKDNTTSGNGHTRNPIFMDNGGSINVNGELNLYGTGLGNSNSHMIYSSSTVNFVIGKNGSLDVQSDSTSIEQQLLHFGGSESKFRFSDAKRVNLQRTNNIANGSSSNNGLIYSGGNLDVNVQNVYQWKLGNRQGNAATSSGCDHSYEPMSAMIIKYGGSYSPTIDSASSITGAVTNNFKTNFTTMGQQRVLFTQIPDPQLKIHSVACDNPDDPNSVTVKGYARPNSYLRIWEEAKNNTSSAKEKYEDNSLESPVKDSSAAAELLNNFTVKSNSEGIWTYTLSNGKHLQAGNIIHVYGLYNLKTEVQTQMVLDKTAPTGTIVDQVTNYNSPLSASDFVDEATIFDTNPSLALPADINIAFDQATTDAAAYAWLTGNGSPLVSQVYRVGIKLSDPAGNTSVYSATMKIEGGTKNVLVKMVNENNKTINSDLIPANATSYTVNVPAEATSLIVKNDSGLSAFIQAILDTGYYQPKNQDWKNQSLTFTKESQDKDTAVFDFKGVLKFATVTKTVAFKNARTSFVEQTILPADDLTMGIIDTRAVSATAGGGTWSLTAKLKNNFVDGTKTLENILFYQGDTGSTIAINQTSETTIFKQHNVTDAPVAVTTDISWRAESTTGLRLRLPTSVSAGKYTGTIQWGLNDTY